MKPTDALAPMLLRWRALKPREQTLVLGALALVCVVLLWWVGLSPALTTLREARAQQALLAADMEKMQRLRAQALSIQAQPKMERTESIRALEALVKQRLGSSAQMSVVGDRVTVMLKGTGPDELAQWLSQARINARAVPSDVRLVRVAGSADGRAGWEGSVTFSLAAP